MVKQGFYSKRAAPRFNVTAETVGKWVRRIREKEGQVSRTPGPVLAAALPSAGRRRQSWESRF